MGLSVSRSRAAIDHERAAGTAHTTGNVPVPHASFVPPARLRQSPVAKSRTRPRTHHVKPHPNHILGGVGVGEQSLLRSGRHLAPHVCSTLPSYSAQRAGWNRHAACAHFALWLMSDRTLCAPWQGGRRAGGHRARAPGDALVYGYACAVSHWTDRSASARSTWHTNLGQTTDGAVDTEHGLTRPASSRKFGERAQRLNTEHKASPALPGERLMECSSPSSTVAVLRN